MIIYIAILAVLILATTTATLIILLTKKSLSDFEEYLLNYKNTVSKATYYRRKPEIESAMKLLEEYYDSKITTH